MTETNWKALAQAKSLRIRHFINGKYRDAERGSALEKYSGRDGRLLYSFGAGSIQEVDEAVQSARTTFDSGVWSGKSVHERKAVLFKLAELIEGNHQEFALFECLDVGKPISSALMGDVPGAAMAMRYAAEAADKLFAISAADRGAFSYHLHKPIGVVAGIVGWNVPLKLAAKRAAPALIMGNSIIVKPSEYTALSASRLAELALEAGVPPGVFNVVHGEGAIVGEALARHMDVDLISFVGSTATGKSIMASAAMSNMKRVIMECGGKSPYLVFKDCPKDLDYLATDIVGKAFPNQGAVCSAGTRLIVQDEIKDALLPKIIERTKNVTPGDPLNEDTSFGAIMSEAHRDKIEAYISLGREEGGEVLCGGEREQAVPGGFYLKPVIFDNLSPNSRVAQEEIFGPVLSVFSFSTEDEAIALANNSDYGLTSYLATENLHRALSLGGKIRAGSMIVTGSSTPLGGGVDLGLEGIKQSGFGVENGLLGLEAYVAKMAIYHFV